MSNSTFISHIYMSGAVGAVLLVMLFILLVRYRHCLADKFLTLLEEEELPAEPKPDRVPLKERLMLICGSALKSYGLAILLVLTMMSWFDLLLYANRVLELNIDWLSGFYGSLMANLSVTPDEINEVFSNLHICVGLAFMVEPLCEIAYFKFIVSRLKPKGRMMTGSECFQVTKEIGERFYSAPFSLMSKPRKFFRKVLFGMGVFLTLSWLVMKVSNIIS